MISRSAQTDYFKLQPKRLLRHAILKIFALSLKNSNNPFNLQFLKNQYKKENYKIF